LKKQKQKIEDSIDVLKEKKKQEADKLKQKIAEENTGSTVINTILIPVYNPLM